VDQLDDHFGKSLIAIPSPFAAGDSCKPSLVEDMGKSILEEMQGIVSELQECKESLQAVQDETKVMQATVTNYVGQRLREHNERWENRIACEVQKQLGVLEMVLQKQEGPCADALPSTFLDFQGQNVETMSCMKSCSKLPSTLTELPPPNTVELEQQDDRLQPDLLMQQAMEIGIDAFEQRLDAAVAKAELAEAMLATPSVPDLPLCETRDSALLSAQSSGNASQLSRNGSCHKRHPCSLFDILEYRRRTCEGLPLPAEVVRRAGRVSHGSSRSTSACHRRCAAAPLWQLLVHIFTLKDAT